MKPNQDSLEGTSSTKPEALETEKGSLHLLVKTAMAKNSGAKRERKINQPSRKPSSGTEGLAKYLVCSTKFSFGLYKTDKIKRREGEVL